MPLNQVRLDDIRPIAIGAGILGTGGGGNTYIGSLQLRGEIIKHGAQRLLDPMSLDDDATVALAGNMGAPTVSIEKIPEGTEMLRSIRQLEDYLNRKIDAVGIFEIGGANAMQPLIAGLLAGIPTIDSDGMGRAFPELQMSSYLFGSDVQVMPLALSDTRDNAVVVTRAISAKWAEDIARHIATSMGARAGLVGFVMTGAQLKAGGIHYTMSLAHYLGQRVLKAQRSGEDVPQVAADVLNGSVIFRGKVTDVERRTTKGFARGSVTIRSYSDRDVLRIEFQNEFLIAYINGEVVVTVPDLICIVTDETGEPVSTELLRYGVRVAVLAVPAPQQLKTAAALDVVGPPAFGYDVDFCPLAGESIGINPESYQANP